VPGRVAWRLRHVIGHGRRGRGPASWLGWVVILALAAGGGAAVLLATRFGPWAHGDSTGYIATARNLLSGLGLGMVNPSGEYRPLSHFPPLYPLTLGAMGLFHLDVIDAARFLDVGLLAAVIALIGWWMKEASDSYLFGALIAAIVLTSSAIVRMFTGAMSEPLFVFLSIGCTALLAGYLRHGKRRLLLLSAAAAALASLTRYVGVGWIAAGSLAVLSLGSFDRKRRVIDALGFGVVSAIPMLGWLLFLAAQPAPRTARSWALDVGELWSRLGPFRLDLVEAAWGLLRVTENLPAAPYRMRLLLLGLVFLTQLVLLVYFLRTREQHGAEDADAAGRSLQAAGLSFIFVIFYGIVLALAFLFSLPSPDINERMLAPVVPLAWIVLACTLAGIGKRTAKERCARCLLVAAVAAMMISDLPASLRLITRLHESGEGYTSKSWRSSETIQVVRGLPASAPLVSNQPDAILLLTGRPAYEMSELVDGEPRQSFSRFGDNLEEDEERAFIEQGAALVLFNSITGQLKNIYSDEAETRLQALTRGLYLFARVEDGAVYLSAPP